MRPIHTNLPAPTGGMLAAKRPTGIMMMLVVLLIALILQAVPAVIERIITLAQGSLTGQPLAPGEAVSAGDGITVIAAFSFGMITLWLWFWLAVKEKRGFATLGFTRPRNGLLLAARGFGLGVAMLAVCVLIPVITGQAQLTWGAPTAASGSLILIMMIGFLVQGSAEEIMTRGYFTQAVARRWGLVAAVIAQAVFFTVLHGANPGMGVVPIINLLLFAFFMSFLSLAEGGLWGVCALHASWNWAQGNIFGVAVSGSAVPDSVFTYAAQPDSVDVLTGGTFGIEGSLVTTIVLLACCLISWRAWQKRRSVECAAEVTTEGATSHEL